MELANLNAGDWSQLEPLFRGLLDRPILDSLDATRWLYDFSDLSAHISEEGSRRYIAHTCHTEDDQTERAYMHFVEHVQPNVAPASFKLQKKFLDALRMSDGVRPMAGLIPGFEALEREWGSDVGLFREQNVPLQTQTTKLYAEYQKTCGAMTVEFDGRRQTLAQLARYLEETDRDKRKTAWELSVNRRLQDREKIEDLFDHILPLREQIALNAGHKNYRDYAWVSRYRFDYTPSDCDAFASSVEKLVLPLVRKINDGRRESMGLKKLRPWDMSVDVLGRAPLRPFDADNAERLLKGCQTIFERLSPDLGSMFRSLRPGRNLDLESRIGKAPGGYQSSLEVAKEPFIFMNAAGTHGDVRTMLHEAGHAFHYMLAKHQPLLFVRSAPIEFCEVASMTMELLGHEDLSPFYPDSADAQRALRHQLEGILVILPWIATIDQFQHWVYTHPGHSRNERQQAWHDTLDRFTDDAIDWSGYEEARANMWHRQLHVFGLPFYYIEYGIAQLGALGVWMNYKKNPTKALSDYMSALSLGGTRPLPELFHGAGVPFDFSSKTIGPMAARVDRELAKLPV